MRYQPDQPQTYALPDYADLVPSLQVAVPAAYAIAPQWAQVIARIRAHGLHFTRLHHTVTVAAQTEHLDHPQWAQRPFEGHFMLRHVDVRTHRQQTVLPAGTVIVPTHQRGARVAMALLEPQAPDSLLTWGEFNIIFEAREYGEPRVLEGLARRMLANDPKLKAVFENRLARDRAFAASPRARLDFFYRRSPRYQVQHVGDYPVVRLDAQALHMTDNSG